MRILQISSARDIGGGERHVADLAAGLTARGCEVFAAVRPGSPLLAELKSPPANIFEVRMRGALDVAAAAQIATIVRENRIDIIHAHLARDYPIAAMAAARSRGTPFVFTRHVLFPMSRIHKLLLRKAARVIAVSQGVDDILKKQRIFKPEKIVTIHNGIDLQRFTPQRAQQKRGRLTVGMIGDIAPIKGQADLMRAAAAMVGERDDVDFVIAGRDRSTDGRHLRELEQLIKQLSISDRVKLLGWNDDVAALLSSFDVYVSPSRFDAFGIAIVEAMASGVPVVATACAGAMEIIEDGKTGRVVPIGDHTALAAAITQLLDDEPARSRLAEAALESVKQKFSLDKMAASVERVYLDILR